jgi:hypothetical protein
MPVNNPADFTGWIVLFVAVAVVLTWYIIFVQNRRR